MIKKLLVVFVTAMAVNTYSQQGTASPYSFYGIGTLNFKGTVENRSMGGLSIYNDSIHLNLRNPAFYTGNNLKAYNEESRPVRFSVGGNFNSTNLKSNTSSAKANATSFEYLAMNLPIGKFGLGFGLLPFTSVGYNLQDINDEERLANIYEGDGGVNKAFLGLAYSVNKKLRVGLDVSYNFGSIENSAIAFLRDSEGVPLQFQTRQNNQSNLSGLNYNFGANYTTTIFEKYDLTASATFQPESNLTSRNNRSFSTITFNSTTGAINEVDTIEADLEAAGLAETDLTLPMRYGFGAGIGLRQKWFVGAEYSMQQTSKFANPIVNIDNSTFENAYRISVGGFYLPNYNAFTGYLKRVTYRAGLRYETTGLNINNQSIDEFGITFGMSLPLGNMFSLLNLGFEYGQRGTTKENLIQENFFNTSLSLSLNDRWFQKRKFN